MYKVLQLHVYELHHKPVCSVSGCSQAAPVFKQLVCLMSLSYIYVRYWVFLTTDMCTDNQN